MFDRFDDVEVPDQWDEIAARAVGPSGRGYEPGGGGHRIAILAVAAAAVIGLAGVLWVVSGDGDDLATVDTPADTVPESTTPVATTIPATTAPPTTVELTQPPATSAPVTVAETVPPETTAPATTAVVDPAECGESAIARSADGAYQDDPALDRFGPLGAAPALDIETGWPEMLGAFRDVTRVPGGTAILLQTSSLDAPTWSLTVVNDDGSIRWRRCRAGTYVVHQYALGRAIVMAEQAPASADPGLPPFSWRAVDVSTGADLGSLDVPSDPNTRVSPIGAEPSAQFLLFGAQQPYNERGEPLPGAPDAMLRLFDGMTITTTDVPYPPDYYTGAAYADWLQLIETTGASDGWILVQSGDQYAAISSVFVDGTWTDDPAVIRSLVPVAAYSPYGIGSEWSGVDPLGETVWTLPGMAAYWNEGAESRSDDGIDLLSVCERYDTTADGGFACVSPGLVGVDGTTGAVLWELPGHRMTAAIGDGFALITDGTENINDGTPAATWLMIDTATGEPVNDQSWSFETFEEDYSMEEDGIWVRQEGGVVIAVNGEHVRVWLPEGMSGHTINVAL